MGTKITKTKQSVSLLNKKIKNTLFSFASIFFIGLIFSYMLPPISKIATIPSNHKQQKNPFLPSTMVKPVITYVPPPLAKPQNLKKVPNSTNILPSTYPNKVIKPIPRSSVNTLSPAPSTTTTPQTTTTPTSSPSSSSSPSPQSAPPSSNPPPSSSSSSSSSTTSYTSSNWAGYLAARGQYSAISADWTVPTVSGNGSSMSADATWIGIGGVTTSDLIQVGTDDTVSSSGTVNIGAFYELLPNASININSLNVSAGDQMSAQINEVSSNNWTITIKDLTKNQTFSINVSYASTLSSAEWIEEDPSDTNGNLLPLDNFGTVSFTSAFTTISGVNQSISNANASSITMLNSANQPIATPSSLNTAAGFSVTRQNPS